MMNAIHHPFRGAVRGQGPVLLLVHGFPFDHRMWAPQLTGLAPQARVIAPDLRGFGRAQGLAHTGLLSMEQHADDLAALLDHLSIQQAVIAGLSMGGYIALAFWRRHPQRVWGLILLDTRAEPDSSQARANRDASIARVREFGAAGFARDMLPRLLAPGSLMTPRVAEGALRIMAEQPAEGICAALAGLRDRADSRPILPTITVPTLALVGEHDVLTPPADMAGMAAAIPGARLQLIPRAGHLSTSENPRAVNAALRAFLRHMPGAS